MKRTTFILGALGSLLLPWRSSLGADRPLQGGGPKEASMKQGGTVKVFTVRTGKVEEVQRVVKTDEEWKRLLTAEQYQVTRKKGTERAFSGQYHAHKEKGIYRCICCGTDLFSSDAKYESGTGWPSYWAPVSEHNVATEEDRSYFVKRVEVHCSRCDAHLGHVFDDGPRPTGKRYCMNSASLKFVPAEQ